MKRKVIVIDTQIEDDYSDDALDRLIKRFTAGPPFFQAVITYPNQEKQS